MQCVVRVRWPLLESYALARQEGLTDPVGLVVDLGCAYAREVTAHTLLALPQALDSIGLRVTCLERGILNQVLQTAAPQLVSLLGAALDEPGRWTAVVLGERGWVVSGSWQDLITARAPKPHSERGGAR